MWQLFCSAHCSFLCSRWPRFDDSAVGSGLLDLASVCDLFCWRADWLFVFREVVDFLQSFFLLTSLSPPGSLGALPSFPSLHFHFFCPFCQSVPVVMVPVAGAGTVVLSLPSWACLSCLAF